MSLSTKIFEPHSEKALRLLLYLCIVILIGKAMKKRKYLLSLLAIIVSTTYSNSETTEATPPVGNQKALVVYFTRTGNTKQVADFIHETIESDRVELKTVEPYPESYNELLTQAQQEINSGYSPPLSTTIENMESYDIVFVGYPIWHGTTPPPIVTFLTEYDFSGKIVVPFCTSASSSGSSSFQKVQQLCLQSTVLDGLWLMSSSVESSQTRILEWLNRIGILGDNGTGLETVVDTKNTHSVSITESYLHVSGDFNRLTLINMNGAEISRTKEKTMPVGNLPAGIYFLKIDTKNNAMVTKKVIKK